MMAGTEKIRIGISSCLLGAEVRFDGGHKRDAYITGTLSQHFELVAVCPEVSIGLGVPRQPIRLVKLDGGVRARAVWQPSLDVTEALQAFGREMGERLSDISGYIFKRASPSCGMERVDIHDEAGKPVGAGVGAYASAFMATQPLLPCEDEGRLRDPGRREKFIERVLAYHRG